MLGARVDFAIGQILEWQPVHKRYLMATYILMGTLTEEGRKTVKERPQRVLEVNKEIESFGARVIAQYVVLGLYDFVTVLQAPDNETVARISAEFGSRGTLSLMSMPAFDVSIYIHQIMGSHAEDDAGGG